MQKGGSGCGGGGWQRCYRYRYGHFITDVLYVFCMVFGVTTGKES